jgi:N6-adenosine-specific RNA methylase IME4
MSDQVLAFTVQDLACLVRDGKKFGTIYADPPWRYDNTASRGAASNHYGTMSIDEICALPVRELAADDAHLHCWTVSAFLFESPRIFEAWGFEFVETFVWGKKRMGLGNYWRKAHELMLTGVRGNARYFRDNTIPDVLICDRGKHSAKPEQVRTFIERTSPGPYLELFGRRPVRGWAVFGNQIEHDMFTQDIASYG